MDWNKAYLLLHVAKEAFGYPQLRPMQEEALKELVEMLDELQEEQKKAQSPVKPSGSGQVSERRM